MEALLFGKDKEININDKLGQKMCLVLCLQRGHLDEALKLANQLHEKNKKNTVLNELIRCIPERIRQIEAAKEMEVSESDSDNDEGFASYSSDDDADNEVTMTKGLQVIRVTMMQ